MFLMRRLLIALLIVSATVAAQTFATTTVLPASLADGGSNCSSGAPLYCIVPVSGLAGVSTVSLNFTFAPAHTFYSDVRCTLTRPSGASVLALASACDGSLGDGSDLGGPYTVMDGAPSFDGAAAAASAVIPAGTYGPDNAMNVLLSACSNPNGNWIVTFQDAVAADVGTIAACSLTFGGSNYPWFSICQTGPSQPVTIAHHNLPGNIYFNPATANTPSAVQNGWFFGIDIPYATLVDELMLAPPLGNIFHGTIGPSGVSVVVVPGVPGGWTIQIVGVHFDGTTGDLIYASPAINYTVQ